jgi:hypothetical protein
MMKLDRLTLTPNPTTPFLHTPVDRVSNLRISSPSDLGKHTNLMPLKIKDRPIEKFVRDELRRPEALTGSTSKVFSRSSCPDLVQYVKVTLTTFDRPPFRPRLPGTAKVRSLLIDHNLKIELFRRILIP